MTNYVLMFVNPLLLLLLIPALGLAVVPYFLVAKKFRRNRNRIVSLILHCTAITLAVFLLAGVSYSYDVPNTENEIILLVDCSDSNDSAVAKKDEFIENIVNLCGEDYKLGIVKFGYDQLYVAKLSNDAQNVYRQYLESGDPDTSATDVASALKYASTLFKSPTTSKIVLVSDGIETDGTAMSAIKSIAASGIRVDTAYFSNETHDEVQIVGVKLPDYKIIPKTESKIELDLKSNFGEDDGNPNKNCAAVITVYDNGEKCGEYFYFLKNGLQTVELMHEFDSLGAHNMKFEISNYEDTSKKNNTYHAFVKFDYLNRILLIEHRSGESQKLQSLLTDSYNYDVTALGIDTDFDSIPKTTKELCAYDQVILVNIANSDLPPEFDGILYKYVNQFGGGLLTVGGENSEKVDGKDVPHAYNSEDLANTLLGEMLPVQAVDYEPPIAVMIVIDCSGSMSDEKLPQAKIGAKACLDVLKDKDYCGIMSFNTEAGEEINVIPVSQKDRILKAINEVGKGDDSGSGGTIFTTAIDNAGRALAATDVERRHIIIVTDGNPSDNLEDFGQHIDNNLKSGITMSIVGIQTSERDIERMKEVCKRSDGVFYHVPKGEFNNLPTIMAKDLEMKVVAGIDYGTEFYPTIENATSTTIFDKELNSETKKMIQIKQEEIPPLTGYYGTRLKTGATVYLKGNFVPIYAQWEYGNGKVGSFMCDLDGIWSEKFMNDNIGQLLIYNIIQNLFPLEEIKTDELVALLRQDNYSVQLSVSSKLEEGQKIEVDVTPLTDEAIAFYKDPIPVEFADGYTRFMFDITCEGVYKITMEKKDADGNVIATLDTYYSFSYSQEYNLFPERELIGEEYMTALAEDGRGIVVEYEIDIFNIFDKYIHKHVDPRIGMLIAIIVLFLLDIAVRKFKFKWPHEIIRDYKVKKATKAKH